MDWYHTHDDADCDAEEDRHEVGLAEALGLVAHEACQVVDALFGTHDLDTVADLQYEVRIGLQVDTASQDAGHVDAVLLADVELAEALAGDGALGDGEAAVHELAAGSLPLLHIHGEGLSEDDADFVLVLDVSYYQQFVSFLEGLVEVREKNLSVPHHTRHD